jgi:hypothetical protein
VSDPVEAYFSQLRDIHASGAGVAEVSYYPALKTLLDEVGRHLKPKVTALMQLRNTGAGIPDGGLFTAGQLKGWEPGTDPLTGQLPQRGAIEVKGVADDAFTTAKSEQVARYVERYGLVLVTNLRDFVLVGRAADGAGVQELESCRLSVSEAAFWAKVQQPRKYAEDAGEGLTEFLRRVLLHEAPLTDPKDVAWFLASYARTARLRLEQRHELPALASLRQQLEESLGLKFEGEKGDHFFRSTLVQTLFYGMFASWVLWARERDNAEPIPWDRRFQWETATATLHVPMVYELFRQFADVRQLGALGISEVLEWAEQIIWRIDRAAFFEKFREEHAVQYFYEPFLEAFDPELRKELGVWYTPDEVVRYMVARVDTVLREELGIADGLADPSVVVLDPCCGTGAYLVEVLRKIDQTLQAKGADALTRNEVKQAAMHRVIGFEIMPAPFVVAHLQLGILLAELGVPLKDADERAAVYLTNALTGWGDGSATPPKDKRVGEGQLHSTLLFPEFAEERDAADRVKREEQILVVIGNPPYNGFAGMAVDEERGLSDAYRSTMRAAKPQGQGLNDLYVRFFRMAERQIAERSARGIVCFISNYSWLGGMSFTGMREKYLDVFNQIWIDNLHGDRIISEYAPDGRSSETVFALAGRSPGIKVGTAIALMCVSSPGGASVLRYRDFDQAGAAERRQAMLRAAARPDNSVTLKPAAALGFPFKPAGMCADYMSWPRIPDLFPSQFPGIITARDQFVVDIDRPRLEDRLAIYFDPSASDDAVRAVCPEAMSDASRFEALPTRRALVARGLLPERIVKYQYRPFDSRWIYWEPDTKLLHEKRSEYWPTAQSGTPQFVMAQKQRRGYDPPVVTTATVAFHLLERGALAFPLTVAGEHETLLDDKGIQPNLTPAAASYLSSMRAEPDSVFWHAVAILHSTSYFENNEGALGLDWPRLPLPMGIADLLASSALGRRVGKLIDGSHDGASMAIGVLSSASGGMLNSSTELGITARWGSPGRAGVTMPSTGKLAERAYTDDELPAIAKSVEAQGMSRDQAVAFLGDTCFDVYLNDVAYWRCIPANVWRYTIGGYQVIKKWLSYRERALLGRDLTTDEARYVTEMVRRIAALVLMGPELDANYERVKADVWEWGQ